MRCFLLCFLFVFLLVWFRLSDARCSGFPDKSAPFFRRVQQLKRGERMGGVALKS
jgi:hypothetical protein